MKTKRHEAILKIISENEVYTQEGLQQKLSELGFEVTQATVSRDIKSLDLVKIITPEGKYRYAPKLADQVRGRTVKFHSIFVEAVIHVDYAQNIVVVKCHVGMGNAACAALDVMDLEGVVGTLAGDDTIFILMRDERQAQALVAKIEEMLARPENALSPETALRPKNQRL